MLRTRLGALARRRRSSTRRVLMGCGGLFGALWVATVLASQAPWWVVGLFWLAFGVVIGLWVLAEEWKSIRQTASALESALRANQATEIRVQAHTVAEIEEREDEGACWLFELGDERLLVLSGQDYYATRRFPNDDFSVVRILKEGGEPLETVLALRGSRLQPVRRMPSRVRSSLPATEGPALIRSSIDKVEWLLEDGKA